jgi:hypothetical protein
MIYANDFSKGFGREINQNMDLLIKNGIMIILVFTIMLILSKEYTQQKYDKAIGIGKKMARGISN